MMKDKDNTLALARDFIKKARGYARYKQVDGYNEDDYDLLEFMNLDASLEICKRGPADYYYEKAYDMFCTCLGKDHPETRQLVNEIIDYHVHNVQRMMQENYTVVLLIIYTYLTLNLVELIPDKKLIAFYIAACQAALAIYWYLEQTFMCFLERRHYRRVYNQ
ncbi:MAG: hypothetical protein IJ907_03900 [Prevotella sp.]|nr:hypothetical protein [Prevotella sp.]